MVEFLAPIPTITSSGTLHTRTTQVGLLGRCSGTLMHTRGQCFFRSWARPHLAGAPTVSDSSCSYGAGGSGKKQLRLRQSERGRDPDAEKEAWSAAAKALSGKAARNCIEGGVGYASIPLALYYESDKTVDHQVQAALDLGESVRAHLRVAVRREEEMHQGILNAKRERALLKLRECEQKASEKREKMMVKEEREKTKEESSRLCDGSCEGDQGSGVRHTGSACRKRAKRSKSPGKPLLDSLHGHFAARIPGSAGATHIWDVHAGSHQLRGQRGRAGVRTSSESSPSRGQSACAAKTPSSCRPARLRHTCACSIACWCASVTTEDACWSEVLA